MTTTSSTFVITLVDSITDNKIDNAIVEKIEVRADNGQTFNPVTRDHETEVHLTTMADTHSPLTQSEKSKSLEYIYADFKDGVGIQLVSINDTRLLDFFTPCYKIGANIRPAMGATLIRSNRQVRGYRVSGLALVKCE